jgi:hypothetical protein
MTANEICRQAAELGLRLEPSGDRLAVIPGRLCPPDFAETLRERKREILDFLDARAANLPTDCGPWLHVARQVLEGQFDGADGSTRQSLEIGLRSVIHPQCRSALERLATQAKGRNG